MSGAGASLGPHAPGMRHCRTLDSAAGYEACPTAPGQAWPPWAEGQVAWRVAPCGAGALCTGQQYIVSCPTS